MISVCIATHNGDKYIEEQLKSILRQLSSNDEIIISDDGSSDNTLNVIKNIGDLRIKVYNYVQSISVNGKNKGFYFASANFGNALNHAKGDYIFLCDQDDIWYPNKVSTCLEYLKHYEIVKHDFSTIDSNGVLLLKTNYKIDTQINRSYPHLIKHLPFRGCCMAFRKDILKNIIPLPKKCLQHDSWIGLMARYKGRNFKYIDQPLIYHRIHNRNLSELQKPNSIFFQIYYRLRLLIQVILRQ